MKTLLLLATLPALLLLAAWGNNPVVATSPSQITSVCPPNPDPATPDTNQVDAPTAGTRITSPVIVRGRILAFEAVFKVTIFGAAGNQIADARGMSAEGTALSPFEVQVPFSVTAETPACMWVYAPSARDGSPSNVIQIPLTLLPAAAAGGLPGTGGGSSSDSETWPALSALAGMLLLFSGGTALAAVVKRR
jgi:Immunoglobulin-like domain of bacterial spore germination